MATRRCTQTGRVPTTGKGELGQGLESGGVQAILSTIAGGPRGKSEESFSELNHSTFITGKPTTWPRFRQALWQSGKKQWRQEETV